MKFYEASFGAVVTRYYLVIAVALIAGFAGIPWLALLCLPLSLSAMLGVKFEFGTSGEQMNAGKLEMSKSSNKKINQAA